MEIFKMIKIACAEKKVTIAQLEREVGLGNNSISKWKTSCPSVDSLYKVANFLDKTMEYFIVGENASQPQILSEIELELLSVCAKLSTKKKHELLARAYELEKD